MQTKTTITDKVAAYYLKGLNYNEIGKLLDISPRTVQRYIKESNCKLNTSPKTLQQLSIDLCAKGWSYSEVAKKLKKSRTTIYLWNKKAKETKKAVGLSD